MDRPVAEAFRGMCFALLVLFAASGSRLVEMPERETLPGMNQVRILLHQAHHALGLEALRVGLVEWALE